MRSAIDVNYVLAAVLAGSAARWSALVVGHIDPEIRLLDDLGRVRLRRHPGRHRQRARAVPRPLVFESIRTFAYEYSPNTWQLVLGLTMLLVILFLPAGLWSVFARRTRAAALTWPSSSRPAA